jgi:hypothetical protein
VRILIVYEGGSGWSVQLTPEFGVGGFTSQEAASLFVAQWLAAAGFAQRDQSAELMRAALIAADPRGKTS